MGIIQRQGALNSISLYIGIAVGFVTRIVLFPRALSTKEIGLIVTLVSIGQVFSQIAALGFPTVILRYFPYFKHPDKHHHGLLGFSLLVTTIGFVVLAGPFVLIRPWVVAQFPKAPMLTDYYLLILPLTLVFTYTLILESLLRSLYKTVVSTFIREVYVKVAGAISILLIFLGLVEFEGFLAIYLCVFLGTMILMGSYLAYLGQFKLWPLKHRRLQRLWKSLVVYGSFLMMGNVSIILVTAIDSIMLTQGLGLEEAGIYSTVAVILVVVVAPARAIFRIVYPMIATYWKEKARDKIQTEYQRISKVSLFLGLFVGGGVITNRDNFFDIIGDDSYRVASAALLILIVGRLTDMITSINYMIISTSKYFRWDLYFNLMLMVFAIISNVILIRAFQITGAAIATSLTLTLVNLLRAAFLYHKERMHPFSRPMIGLFIFAGIGIFSLEFLPKVVSFWWDIPLRSLLYTLVFVGPVLAFRLIPEINQAVVKQWKRFLG